MPIVKIIMVARDCLLALKTGARVNIQHISSRGAVEMVRSAKKLGAKVYAEVTPHHFSLTQEAVLKHGTYAKMNPPLRSEADRIALIEGLRDGTIDCIATDSAPHTDEDKLVEFSKAMSGIIGFGNGFIFRYYLFGETGVFNPSTIHSLHEYQSS